MYHSNPPGPVTKPASPSSPSSVKRTQEPLPFQEERKEAEFPLLNTFQARVCDMILLTSSLFFVVYIAINIVYSHWAFKRFLCSSHISLFRPN